MVISGSERDPRSLYTLMIGAIVPRPIAFVSSLSRNGVRNLAPFSFFTAISANPPVICFCPMVRSRDGTQKDTLLNVEATGEFVVNIVSEDFAEQMNICSIEFPPDVDEFQQSSLTPVASDIVGPPRVMEARVSMECRLREIVRVSTEPLGGNLVIGDVLLFHVQDDLVIDDRINPEKLQAIGRMGGRTYVRTTDLFDLVRVEPPMTAPHTNPVTWRH